MIKTKSAILILMTALAFVGCGTDTSKQSIEAADVLVETSEVYTETPTNSTTTTTKTTQATSKTTTTSTTTLAATTAMVTTTAEPVTEPEPVVTEPSAEPVPEPPVQEVVEPTEPPVAGTPGGLIYSGMRGTYYAPGSWNGYSAVGGSGRSLLDCNGGGDGYAKGSIASRYLYNLLGYYSNGGRTAVWLSVAGYPDMDGIYYLDDCSGADVIDFFYNANGNCQFCYAGVVSVDIHYVN